MSSPRHTPLLNRRLPRILPILALPAILAIASCGTGQSDQEFYPVSGTVTYNGNPLEKGLISFLPDDQTKPGAGSQILSGSYSLTTGGETRGARDGKYKVTITARENLFARARAEMQKATGDDSGVIPKAYFQKAETQAKSLVPPGYGDYRTTPFTAEVKPGSNSFDFKLSDAEAPRALPPETSKKPRPEGSGRKGH